MAYTSREVVASVHDVFAILTDPRTYPDWLAGASDIRAVDDDWPRPGSKFHHWVGLGPFRVADSTKVVEVEPDRLLRLAVRARPFVSAIATFTLVGDDERCAVALQEEPAVRVVGTVVRPVMDPVTHVRNHLSLKRLAGLAATRARGRTNRVPFRG
jgi:uncharacterized protein YndB with AHSA1/START domain